MFFLHGLLDASPPIKDKGKQLIQSSPYKQDVQWCLDNQDNLPLPAFADHFGYKDKRLAHDRYSRILKQYVKNEGLIAAFDQWKRTDEAEEYWNRKVPTTTVRRSQRKAAQHVPKAISESFKQLDEYFGRQFSPSNDSANENSDYAEPEAKAGYRLTFDGLDGEGLTVSSSRYSLLKKQTAFDKRIASSSIALTPEVKMVDIKSPDLTDACYLMIRQFKRTAQQLSTAIPVDCTQSSERFWPFLYSILTYSLNTIKNEKHKQKQVVSTTSETDFITKYVANFLQSCIFFHQERLLIRWNVQPLVYGSTGRPDSFLGLYSRWY